jgi:uncharacterized LabA/DUF88 family protein
MSSSCPRVLPVGYQGRKACGHMQLNVLIDYDNVHEHDRRIGLSHVIAKITRLIDSQSIAGITRIVCRLYGGWFDSASPTRTAQFLTTEIQAHYPSTTAMSATSVIVDVQFAKALLADPANVLTHTFRPYGQPPRLVCTPTPYRHCLLPGSCPLAPIASFINRGACTQSQCTTTPSDLLTRAEQKLVDTMLVADISHLAYAERKPLIVVVSADDDIWPGILSALLVGTAVHRIYPKPGFGVRKRYVVPRSAAYTHSVF